MTAPDYKALCKRLSDALLKVRPLGGSELFMRISEDEYFADPEYCGRLIEELREELHNAKTTLAWHRKYDDYRASIRRREKGLLWMRSPKR